jgi:hypothetical protein
MRTQQLIHINDYITPQSCITSKYHTTTSGFQLVSHLDAQKTAFFGHQPLFRLALSLVSILRGGGVLQGGNRELLRLIFFKLSQLYCLI